MNEEQILIQLELQSDVQQDILIALSEQTEFLKEILRELKSSNRISAMKI